MNASRHLWELGQDRERVAIERWMFANGPELLAALGLEEGWWCGLFLRRRDLFGDAADGDVDLIAGPLTYSMNDAEWQRLVETEQKRNPGASRSLAVALAHRRAGERGFVEWPPRLDFVVACEVKASFFTDEWKRTHEGPGEQRDLLKQLRYLDEKGINRISFLHLGCTKPIEGASPSWLTVAEQLDRAMLKFPKAVSDPDRRYGYFRGVMGAVPDGTEDMAGAYDGLTALARAAVVNEVGPRPWHDHLRMRLAALPRPAYFRTCILDCDKCRSWRLADSAARERVPCRC